MARFLVSAWSATTEQASYEAYRAGDGIALPDGGMRWASANATVPCALRTDLGTARVVTWYQVSPSMYAANQDPTAWTFEGSADGATGWVVLDTRSSITWPLYTCRSFTFANSTAYRYYRLNVTANGGVLTSIAELQLGDGAPLSRLWDWEMSGASNGNSGSGEFTLSVEFYPTIDLNLTHLSYYEASAQTGVVTLRLRDVSGAIVTSTTDVGIGGRYGWRDVAIPPITITANTHYEVEIYFSGYFAIGPGTLATPRTNNDLVLVANGSGTVRGVTFNPRYSSGNNLATTAGSNYLVGVVAARDLPIGVVQVDTLYGEALTLGGGQAQVDAHHTEMLTLGLGVAQSDATYAEALTLGGGQVQTDTLYVEALTIYGPPPPEVAGIVQVAGGATLGTTWASLSGPTSDLYILAAAGDWVEVGIGVVWDPSGAFPYHDIATIVSGAPLNWVSTGTTSHAQGVPGMFQTAGSGYHVACSGSVYYQVKAGDVVDGVVRLRLYGKTNTATKVVNAGTSPYLWAAPMPSAPVTAMVTGTLTTTSTMMTGSVTLPCGEGDWVEVLSNMLVNPGAPTVAFDACTVVSGAPVNYVGLGGSTMGGGQGGWRCARNDYDSVGGGGMLYQVKKADLVAGSVTFRAVGWTTSGTTTLDAVSYLSARVV